MTTIAIAYTLKLHHNIKLSNNYIFILSDSIGLSLFAYTCAITALNANFNFSEILFLSFLTDALLIGLAVWILSFLNFINTYSSLGVLIIGTIIRLIAIKNRWKLPKLF